MSDINHCGLIRVNKVCLDLVPAAKQSDFGRADVLQAVLPQLCQGSSFHELKAQTLKNIDQYMLSETTKLLAKLGSYFERLFHQDEIECGIDFDVNDIVFTSDHLDFTELAGLVNRDKWCTDIFSWLQPNYLGLVHSIEMLNFSKLYQDNKTAAVANYQHFEHKNNGLECKLLYRSGSVKMLWQSPQQGFYVT